MNNLKYTAIIALCCMAALAIHIVVFTWQSVSTARDLVREGWDL